MRGNGLRHRFSLSRSADLFAVVPSVGPPCLNVPALPPRILPCLSRPLCLTLSYGGSSHFTIPFPPLVAALYACFFSFRAARRRERCRRTSHVSVTGCLCARRLRRHTVLERGGGAVEARTPPHEGSLSLTDCSEMSYPKTPSMIYTVRFCFQIGEQAPRKDF